MRLRRRSSPDAREARLYGARWAEAHGGYFSDPRVAAPLLAAIRAARRRSPPAVVADLGGGTGFLLEQLARQRARRARFVNIESATAQLTAHADPHCRNLHRDLRRLRRADLAAPGERLLLVMRSVLHYFGREGLEPALRHLRRLLRPGERFVHQTVCFATARQAAGANLIYRGLRTRKWYPTVAGLEARLARAGWRVLDERPAASLVLPAAELAERYELPSPALRRLDALARRRYSDVGEIMVWTDQSFTLYLPYRIFTCEAVEVNERCSRPRGPETRSLFLTGNMPGERKAAHGEPGEP